MGYVTFRIKGLYTCHSKRVMYLSGIKGLCTCQGKRGCVHVRLKGLCTCQCERGVHIRVKGVVYLSE